MDASSKNIIKDKLLPNLLSNDFLSLEEVGEINDINRIRSENLDRKKEVGIPKKNFSEKLNNCLTIKDFEDF